MHSFYTGVVSYVPEMNLMQNLALDTLEWLYDPRDTARGTGRTTIMAIAMIRIALRYPGAYVDLHDHAGARQAHNQHMVHTVLGLINSDPAIRDLASVDRLPRQGRLRFRPEMMPLEDWWPPEWSPAIGQQPETTPATTHPASADANKSELTFWDYVQDPTF